MALLAEHDIYLRQQGIFNPREHPNAKVTFVGVGGIGSFAAFGAAKLGIPKITLIDPDVVEPHNQPNQFYSVHDVAENKVEALAGYILGEDTGQEVETYPFALSESDTEVPPLSGVVVSGLDSMEAREHVWQHEIQLNPHVSLYLDARLSGEFIVIYAVNPTDLDECESYRKTLHSDEEGEDISCTARGIIDVGLQVGSMITRALRLYFTGQPVDRITMMNQATFVTTKTEWVK